MENSNQAIPQQSPLLRSQKNAATHSLVTSVLTPTDTPTHTPVARLTYSITFSGFHGSTFRRICHLISYSFHHTLPLRLSKAWFLGPVFVSLQPLLTYSFMIRTHKFIFSLDLFHGPQLMPTIFTTKRLTSFKLRIVIGPSPRWKIESCLCDFHIPFLRTSPFSALLA